MIRGGLMAGSIVMLLLALALGGTAPFGRLALAVGVPQIAELLFADKSWLGVARYRSGKYKQAAQAWQAAGPGEAFNRGNGYVGAGQYAAALEAYDLAMAHDPQDAGAQSNFDLVSAFYAGTQIEPGSWFGSADKEKNGDPVAAQTAQGNARATGTGQAVTNRSSVIGLPALASRDQLGVRKVFDDKFVVASPRWLATLEDVPGAFLAARIAHEYKRRARAGEGQKKAADPL